MATKSRLLSKLIDGTGQIKASVLDSDSIGVSTQKSVTAAAGTALYSSADTLPSTASSGDQAFVTSTNRLYIYSGSGWYNIALVNNTPYWSTEAASSYDLAKDSTPTVVTILAVDSDGTHPTYSAVTDSNFDAIATISKDSDNGRVFTIIPIDSEGGTATAGTGTVTFKASDGISLVSTVSTFSIVFKALNSNYTTFLLKADAAGTDNQVDASTSTHTITETGDVTSIAFTPHHPGGYSTYFDGTSNSNIQVKGESTLAVGTGDFSVSLWYKSDGALDGRVIASSIATASSGTASQLYWNIAVQSNGAVWLQTRSAANGGQQYYGKSATGLVTANTWHHLVCARISGVHYCAVDGVEDTSVTQNTATMNITSQELAIGLSNVVSYESYGKGYIRDLNFCTSGVEYDLSAGNYTVPDEPITAHANTKFLLSGLPYIVDSSASPLTIDIIGSAVKQRRLGPYNYLSYDKVDHGGSVYFDGSGDYITAPQAVSTSLSYQSDFTIEGWFYANDLTGGGTIAASGNGTQTSNIRVLSDGTLFLQIYYSSNNQTLFTTADANKVKLNQWHHIAFVHNYGDYAVPNEYIFYVDGKNVGSTTTAINSYGWYNGTPMGPLYVGKHSYNNTAYWTGYISDFRIVNSLVYDSEFTTPTAPLTPITNTQLLTCTNKNDIWDATIGVNLLPRDNVAASNTERKFATSSAIYFDGSGNSSLEVRNDWINSSPSTFALGSKDFTIEMWVNFTLATSDVSYRRLFMADAGGNASNNFQILVDAGGTFGSAGAVMVWAQDGSNNNFDISSTTAINDGNWHHVAVSRTSNTVRLFVDGVRQGTNLTNWTHGYTGNPIPRFGSDGTLTSGNYVGYIQDARLTVDFSRYSTDNNFTPPTSEFSG